LKFEWREEKNSLNIQKHAISFEEAKEVLLDPLHISKLESQVQEKPIKKKGYSMSNIKDREKYDDYEMLEEYDFSGGVRSRFYEPQKIPVALRLDNDIVLYFKKLAHEKKVPYQTLINALLRKKLQEV